MVKSPNRFIGKQPGVRYQVYSRRRGKAIRLGSPLSDLQRAKSLGIFKTKESLARSLWVKDIKTNRLVNIGNFAGYRPSKKNPLILVQKSKISLSSRGEKEEIKAARRGRKLW
jgi:hypothetical protein